MPIPWIVGAIVVGGILYLFSDSEEEIFEEDENDRIDRIRDLRRELQREKRRQKASNRRRTNVSKE